MSSHCTGSIYLPCLQLIQLPQVPHAAEDVARFKQTEANLV